MHLRQILFVRLAPALLGSILVLGGCESKLTAENFAHLTPHPLKVLFDYTHPPVSERIQHIRQILARTAKA